MKEQIPEKLMFIRDYEPNDKSFIYATWLRGLYYGNSWFTAIDKDAYMSAYHRVIDQLLKKPGIEIRVAALRAEPDVVLGYAVFEPKVLHWIFVKQAWRRFGIAKQLLPEDIQTVTHLTALGESLKPKQWKFNPFKI